MIVVLASRFDADATALVDRWRAQGAKLLTCEGLSRSGWVHHGAEVGPSIAVIDGRPTSIASIQGVVTRLSGVTEAELPHIAPDERAYVACEMNAFLVAWLSSLRCRVLNRPTPLSLSGPSWRPEQWSRAATQAGLSTLPSRRVARSDLEDADAGTVETAPTDVRERSPVSVTLVHTRCIGHGVGPVDGAVAAAVCRLAAAAGVELLTATVVPDTRRPTFVGATPWVDITRADVADALLARIEAPS